MDCETEEGTSLAVLGKLSSRHARRTVYGREGNMWSRRLDSLPGGHHIRLEQDGLGHFDNGTDTGHAKEGPESAAEYYYRV